MRHNDTYSRSVKTQQEEIPYYCMHNDCMRVIWINKKYDDVPVMKCFECGRRTVYKRTNVPDDTIMLDQDGNPIPKDEERSIPMVDQHNDA